MTCGFVPQGPLGRRVTESDEEQLRPRRMDRDLYKWAVKLAPAVPGELLADCFTLAVDIRVLDMRASPYDLAAHGYSPVLIETAAGKAEYAAAQRGFADRGQALRERLLAVCDAVLGPVPA